MSRTEDEVLDAIEKRRRRPHFKVMDEHITLAHGAGGRSSHVLIETLFGRAFDNPLLAPMADAATVDVKGGRLAFSTDSFVVRPLVFPGGDIGELAVNGTVNDLAMAGARPLALSAAFVLEEGFPVKDLARIAESMAAAAAAAGVPIATGDTKVVERGNADGLYICTSGVGLVRDDANLAAERMQPGDKVLVSGTMGDHGMAIMIARGDLELEVDLRSDTAPLNELVEQLLDVGGDAIRCLRDPTRGGLATVLNELVMTAEVGVVIDEEAVPLRPETNGACEILGIDPLHVANEGKLVAVVAPEAAEELLAVLRAHPLGLESAIVGGVNAEPPGMVLLDTAFGGSRVVDMLAGDPLPRIC